MRRSRLLPFLFVGIILGLVLTGCGLVGPTVRLMFGPTTTPSPRAVEKAIVATPTPRSSRVAPQAAQTTQAPVAPRATLPPAPPPATINVPAGVDAESQVLKAVYDKVNPSVVYIENLARLTTSGGRTDPSLPSDQEVPESQGSGFVWDLQGRIVTNDHVVRGADRLEVTFSDGVVLPAELVGTDPDSDLAVIKVNPELVTLVPVETGRIEDVQVGEKAIAIGNPFGLVGTMTSGIVSALGRSIQAITRFSIPEAIQTDAAINPGSSGGPLLNIHGQVIGVNAQIRSDTGSNAGVGFAIPISIVQRIVPALIKDGKYSHAYLGISGQTYTPAWADALGFSIDVRGAYVMTVTSDGPAGKSGVRAGSKDTTILLGVDTSGPVYLQSGGDLIISIDGQPVTKFDDLLIYLERYKSPGDTVQLTALEASGDQRTVTILLGERPNRVQ